MTYPDDDSGSDARALVVMVIVAIVLFAGFWLAVGYAVAVLIINGVW